MSTILVTKKKNFVEKSNNREYKRWLWKICPRMRTKAVS